MSIAELDFPCSGYPCSLCLIVTVPTGAAACTLVTAVGPLPCMSCPWIILGLCLHTHLLLESRMPTLI